MSWSRKLFLLSGVGILLAIMGAYYFTGHSKPETKSEIVKIASCSNPVEGCSGNEISIQFGQIPKVMQPFNVAITSQDAVEVHTSFAMQGMEMGLNRYRFIQSNDKRWQAAVTLPVCVQGRSDWQALIEVETSMGLKRYQFSFSAER